MRASFACRVNKSSLMSVIIINNQSTVTYNEPRYSPAQRACNHRGTEWGLRWFAHLLGDYLLDSLVYPKVQSSSNGVANGMKMVSGVKTAETVTADDLPKSLDGAQSR